MTRRAPAATGAGAPAVALTIAASDSGGGAGIQADLKTFAMHGVFGATVLTASTAQNTLGVHAIERVSPRMVGAQLDAVLADLPVAAVKTGMLTSASVVSLLAERAARLPRLVVDPVLISSSGRRLCRGRAAASYLAALFPHATVVTPNLAEAAALLGRPTSSIRSIDDAALAAAELGAAGPTVVVVTGGHLEGAPVDVLWHEGATRLLTGPRVTTRNDHGTGCVFSAAITAGLALGARPVAAVVAAKRYLSQALAGAATWQLGAGSGPMSWPTVSWPTTLADTEPSRPLGRLASPARRRRAPHDTPEDTI